MADRNRQLLDFLQDNTDRRYDTDEESNFSGFSDGGESDVEVPVFDLDDLSSDSSDDSDHDQVQNQNMEWTGNFTRPVFDDFTEQPGAKLPDDFDTATATPLDYFYLLMQPQLFVDIARHTNNYACWKLATENRDLDPQWEETGANEMRAFVELNVLFGMNWLPRLEMHWSKDRFIGNQGVQDTMTCNRYQKLNQYFHVSDRENELARDSPQYDGLYKVRPVLDHCTQTFQEHYTLSKECVVDEAMIKFQSRHSAKQYMPPKPVKWGIKVWSLCDSRTYYLSKFQIYEGRRNNATEHGLGYNVVRNMTSEIRNSNRHVYFDNSFTSIPLMETLLQDGLYACGTIRTNRKEYPPQLKKPRDVYNRGEFKVLQRGRSNLTASVWKDRKLVHNASTLSDPAEVLPTQRRVQRQVQHFPVPHCVKSYNQFMGGETNMTSIGQCTTLGGHQGNGGDTSFGTWSTVQL